MHRFVYVFVFVKVCAILANSESNSKLGDVIKNHTKSTYGNNGSKNDEENVLKMETHRFLRECGAESDTYDDNDSRRGFSNHNNRRFNGDRGYRNENNGNGGGYHSNNDGYYGNNRGSYNNNNRNNRNNQRDNSNESAYNRYSNQNGNFHRRINHRNNDDCKDDYGGYHSNKPYGGHEEGNYGYDHRHIAEIEYRGRGGFDHLRARRSNNNNNYDSQCISQCVFGYMEVLDDGRVPSETLMIKWLQDHLSNDNMKRIRAFREARRCFARLASEDNEDGCEFSQALSKCLDLELE